MPPGCAGDDAPFRFVSATGTVKQKVAPRSGLFSAQSRLAEERPRRTRRRPGVSAMRPRSYFGMRGDCRYCDPWKEARHPAVRRALNEDPMKDCSSETGVERNFQPSRKGVRK